MTTGIATSGFFLLFLIFAGLLVVLIPVLTGVYVYRDAKSRNMDAALWTLVAVLVPSFIGLIIYLVIRGHNVNLDCPRCKSPVASDYALCPYCGMALKGSCPSCMAPVDNGWKLCPKCGAALPEQTTIPIVRASAKKDKKLVWILISAIAVPVLILVIGIGGMFSWTTTSSMMGGGLPIGFVDGAIFPGVAEWMRECDENGKGVYVLEFSPEKARELQAFTSPQSSYPMSDAENIYCVVIYINEKGRVSGGGGLERQGNTLEIVYDTMDTAGVDAEMLPDYELSYAIACSGKGEKKVDKLRILIDSVEVNYALSELK